MAKAIKQVRDARRKVKGAADALDKTLIQLNDLEYSLKLICEIPALQTEPVEQQVLSIATVAEELRAFLDQLAQEQQKKPLTQLVNALKLGDTDEKQLKGILHRLDRARDELTLRITIAQASLSDRDPCLKDLYSTDPRDDKVRIEETKGGLLYESYNWILDHDDFKKWRNNEVPLLWIKADPGKGKTMLLCGILNQIKPDYTKRDAAMSFFFCQSTDSRLNNASAVLRGLIYLLAAEQPLLLRHIQAQHKGKGKQAFEDANSWVSLSKILMDMLDDPSLQRVCLVVDALDECDMDLSRVLSFILQTAKHSKVKWLVSSRNVLDIEQRLRADEKKIRLCLEIGDNISSVANAVDAYIEHCLAALDNIEDEPELLELVRNTMHEKANGTFLWVSLVAKELREAQVWDVEQVINEVPPDLERLYGRMLKQIDGLKHKNPQNCRLILATVTMANHPLNLEEIAVLTGLMTNEPNTVDASNKTNGLERRSYLNGKSKSSKSSKQQINDMIKLCGSFLTIKDERVFIVHHSAKDFLLGDTFESFFQQQKSQLHQSLYLRSLSVLSSVLRRDIYQYKHPGSRIQVAPAPDPLRKVEYCCANWIVHLQACSDLIDEKHEVYFALEQFLSHKFLYWLEALCLTRRIFEAVNCMRILTDMTQVGGQFYHSDQKDTHSRDRAQTQI